MVGMGLVGYRPRRVMHGSSLVVERLLRVAVRAVVDCRLKTVVLLDLSRRGMAGGPAGVGGCKPFSYARLQCNPRTKQPPE